MRRRGREVLAMIAASAMGALATFAHAQDAPSRPSMTIEVVWSSSTGEPTSPAGSPSNDLTVEVVDGAILEAVAWPWDAADPDRPDARPGPTSSGAWRLGAESEGKARLRIEAGPACTIVARRGDQAVRLPAAAVIDGPQSAPTASGLNLTVRRLPWDVLSLDFGPGAEKGITAPGTAVPVTVGYAILQADAAEVTVRTTAVLRPIGGREAVWEFEQREILPANSPTPPSRLWSIPAPAKEGTYVLEVQAAWEAVGAREGSRLGRLIRRRKPQTGVSTTSRRVVLAVVAPQPTPLSASPSGGPPEVKEAEVDSFDLSRLRNARFSAWGRSPTLPGSTTWEIPTEILSEAGRREREREWLRGFISKPGVEPARLGPAGEAGIAWSAVALHVPHPDRAHRLSLSIAGGDPSALGAVVVDPGNADRRPRVLLDACGATGDAGRREVEWTVWPGCPEPLLVLLNRNPGSGVAVGSIRLVELEAAPTGRVSPPRSDRAGRGVGLQLEGPDAIERFAASAEAGLDDALATAENFATYLTTCGASFVVLPEGMEDRALRRRLAGGFVEDSTGPDRLDLLFHVLRRRGISTWTELDLLRTGALPGLPPPNSQEAAQEGLVRIGADGVADGGVYHPLHPRVREAMKVRIVEALAGRDGRPGSAGVLIRLGRGPTLLGNPDTGLDDETFGRFVREAFGPEVARDIPGLDASDPGRFAVRAKYLAGLGRMPWLTWRARAVASLYTDLSAAVREAAPGALLALATPTLDGGPAGAEARRVDLAGLAPSQAWRSLGFDLEAWPTGPDAPILLRGAGLSEDGLARDLATHPDLDDKLLHFHRRGFVLRADGETGSAPTRPAATALSPGDGPAFDAPLAHAVSALDASWIVLGASAVAGREDRVRRFSEVFRLLPADARPPSEPAPAAKDSGVVVRAIPAGGETVVEMVNDAPYTMRIAGLLKGDPAAAVEDLGRGLKLAPQPAEGGRRLVIDLAPYSLSVIRVGAANATLENPILHPPDAVLASMEARSRDLSTQLAALNRGSSNPVVEPPNAGFEHEEAPAAREGAAASSTPAGWKVEPGPKAATATIDRISPFSGTGSLRLEASQAPSSVVSGAFSPGAGTTLLVQAHLRGDADKVAVKVWIEGERDGRPYLRRSEITIGREWRPFLVRASDVPPGGLDSVRLRFEVASAGTLWIDDVRVRGEAAPKAVRLNAQRTLLAALQAYRERRYSDFARLADSHWARHPGILSLVRGERQDSSAKDAAPKAAEASALPRDRALR